MAEETCVLDPVEFIPERVELALDQLGLEIRAEGVDWGESTIEAQMIRQREGETSSDGHRAGVQIRIPLRVKEEGAVSLAQAAHELQRKAGTIQDLGGWIRRDFDDEGGFAGSIGYKILRHTLSISGLDGWLFAHRRDAPDVVITATRWPIGYPTEERESGANEVTNPGFEDDTTGWTLYEGGAGVGLTLVRATTPAYVADGKYAGYVNGLNTAGTARSKYLWDSNPTEVSPGEVWYLRAVVSGTPETGQSIKLGYRNDSGTITQAGVAPVNKGIEKTGASAGVLMEGFLTVPEGVSEIQAAVWSTLIGPGAEKPFAVDTLMLVKSDEVVPWSRTAGRHLEFTEPASLGSVEGLWRGRFKNTGAEDWRGLILSRECRYAPEDLEDPTARMSYQARDLTPKGGAEVKTVSGVECVQHTALTAGWLTILSSEIAGVGHMTHRGPRPMWVRVEQPSGKAGDVQLRLLVRALGASRWDESLPIVSVPVVGGWMPVFLGVARPEDPVLGDLRWEGKLMVRAPEGSGSIRIRDLYPLSSEQYCVLREPYAPLPAEASVTKAPSTVESDAAGGTIAWTSPANAKSSNNSYASATPGMDITHYLKATGFGFSIPEAATITGIVALVERKASQTGFTQDDRISIVKGGVIGATNKKKQNTTGTLRWEASETIATYGSASDPWGEEWTPADVNAADFGIAISAWGGDPGGTVTASVDALTLIVYYSESELEDLVCFAGRSIEPRSDGVYRQHPTDDVWGRLVPDGFLPTLPAGGVEGRSTRTIIIPSVSDLTTTPDGPTDPRAQPISFGRAGHLFAREAA